MSEWNRTKTIKLGSGRSVTLKPVSLEELVVMGTVPNSLTTTVAKILNDPELAKNQTPLEMFGGDPIEATRASVELNKAMATLALVDPIIVDKPDYDVENPEEASYFDFTAAEQAEIANWINQPIEQLESFPE